jgi:hypothetical protein
VANIGNLTVTSCTGCAGAGAANSKWGTTTIANSNGLYTNAGSWIDVLIGATATTSNAKLEIGVTVAANGSLLTVGSTTLQNVYLTSLNIGSTSANNLGVVNINSAQTLKNNLLWIAGSAADATTTMVITNNGLIGFGTSTPTAQFSIHTASSSPTNGSRQFIFSIGSTTMRSYTLSAPTSLPPVTLFAIDTSGRVYASSTRPTLTTCGSSPTIQGTDMAGIVRVGSATGVCLITFTRSWGNAPFCIVVPTGYANIATKNDMTFVATTSATTLSVSPVATSTAPVARNMGAQGFMYKCEGNIE